MTNSIRIAVILLLKKSANLFASSIVEDAAGYCFSGFRCSNLSTVLNNTF